MSEDAGTTAADRIGEIPESIAAALRMPFDVVLSDPVRLRLQAALCGLPTEGSMGFTALRRALGLSDGNLGAHLAILVEVGYAIATPDWHGRRKVTRYSASSTGRAAFEAHVAALQSVIDSGRRPGEQADWQAGGPAGGQTA